MGEPEGKVELILLINYEGVLSSLIKNQILDPLSCVLLNKTRSGSRIFFQSDWSFKRLCIYYATDSDSIPTLKKKSIFKIRYLTKEQFSVKIPN